MSTQISKSLIALFFLGMFVTGCNTNTKQTADNDIKFDSIRVDRTYHLLNNPDNPNCNLQLNFTYPAKFSDKEILKKIQNDFVLSYFGENYENLSPEEAVAKYTEDYLNNYKELEADFKAELEKKDDLPVGAWFSYFEMSSDEIVYNQNDILSYTVSFENYTGGAHGSHAYNNHVINLKTGNAITEEDIFIENFQDSLAQILIISPNKTRWRIRKIWKTSVSSVSKKFFRTVISWSTRTASRIPLMNMRSPLTW